MGHRRHFLISANTDTVWIDLGGDAVFVIIEKICAKTLTTWFCFDGAAILTAGVRIFDNFIENTVLLGTGRITIGQPFHSKFGIFTLDEKTALELLSETALITQAVHGQYHTQISFSILKTKEAHGCLGEVVALQAHIGAFDL